jgi:hypothetical protein
MTKIKLFSLISKYFLFYLFFRNLDFSNKIFILLKKIEKLQNTNLL